MLWLLGGYMWLFIHRPFEVWPVLGSLHVERLYMGMTLAYWAILADKGWVRNRLNAAFLGLLLAVLVAWVLSPYPSAGSQTVQDYAKVAVFYVLVVSTCRSERDLRRLIVMFLAAAALWMGHSLREFFLGRHEYRQGIARMMGVDGVNDPNTFAATILYTLPLMYAVWRNVEKRRDRLLLVGYLGLAVLCILLTGSRGGFIGLCFLGGAVAVMSKHRLQVLFALVVAAPLIWYGLPRDLKNRFLTIVDPSYGPAVAEASAEGRRMGLEHGVKIWKKHPVFGVGPDAFVAAAGYGMQTHNLYGQVLSETGTAGAIALAAVVYAFVANTLAVRRVFRRRPPAVSPFLVDLSTAIFVSVLLLLLMGFAGHNLYRYNWLWFGAFQAVAVHCALRQARDYGAQGGLEAAGEPAPGRIPTGAGLAG